MIASRENGDGTTLAQVLRRKRTAYAYLSSCESPGTSGRVGPHSQPQAGVDLLWHGPQLSQINRSDQSSGRRPLCPRGGRGRSGSPVVSQLPASRDCLLCGLEVGGYCGPNESSLQGRGNCPPVAGRRV